MSPRDSLQAVTDAFEENDNVTHYGPSGDNVPVDLLHAFRAPCLEMFERICKRRAGSDSAAAATLPPEDLIGFKIRAIVHNPARRFQDLADIRALLDLHHAAIDWGRIEEDFGLFGKQELFASLRQEFPK